MTLHILKLSVDTESVEDLAGWIRHLLAQRRAAGQREVYFHTTRMTPRRQDQLLDDGSVYWVIKGQIQCRQKLTGFEIFTDADGIERCRLMLDPELVPTRWAPRRPFQGWRYLKPEDAPADADTGGGDALPLALQSELATLGLI